MTHYRHSFLVGLFFFCGVAAGMAQSVLKKNCLFSAIQGTVSKPDIISINTGSKNINWLAGDSAYFSFQLPVSAAGNNRKLLLLFTPPKGFTGIARATLRVDKTTVINCTGLSTKGLEGENEPPLSVIVNALGYDINVGWTSLANHSRPELQGDETGFSLFHKAGKGKVEMMAVARYSPDFELPFGYYTHAPGGPVKHSTGILALAGKYPEHQSLFPALSSGSNVFDPGDEDFGFYASGPSHTAYSEDVWNLVLHPENAVRAVRIYPVKSNDGASIKNTWLVCFEEAKNGDFNDYVFVVKNVVPVSRQAFAKIFNGSNLKGWHTYLKDIGRNTDPGNNFRIEDSSLHVIGKELGYAITDSAYHNFHLKVDFKWGAKKWPPRDSAKRDAGICYNIPVNEPDSIWPVSIECQVQEGDVGDFWLLGFSTISVDGKTNRPSVHTQVVKKKDGEKPVGEWNTVEVISYNGTCVHIVNGVVVNYGSNASVKDGRILLQSEYAEVFYRNVMVRRL